MQRLGGVPTWIGVALTLIGAGLLIHGILGYSSRGDSFSGTWSGWSTQAKLEAAVGVALAVGGSLFCRARK